MSDDPISVPPFHVFYGHDVIESHVDHILQLIVPVIFECRQVPLKIQLLKKTLQRHLVGRWCVRWHTNRRGSRCRDHSTVYLWGFGWAIDSENRWLFPLQWSYAFVCVHINSESKVSCILRYFHNHNHSRKTIKRIEARSTRTWMQEGMQTYDEVVM